MLTASIASYSANRMDWITFGFFKMDRIMHDNNRKFGNLNKQIQWNIFTEWQTRKLTCMCSLDGLHPILCTPDTSIVPSHFGDRTYEMTDSNFDKYCEYLLWYDISNRIHHVYPKQRFADTNDLFFKYEFSSEFHSVHHKTFTRHKHKFLVSFTPQLHLPIHSDHSEVNNYHLHPLSVDELALYGWKIEVSVTKSTFIRLINLVHFGMMWSNTV